MTFRLDKTEISSMTVLSASQPGFSGSLSGSSQMVTLSFMTGHTISNASRTVHCNRKISNKGPATRRREVWRGECMLY